MAMLKIPSPDRKSQLIFDISQVANVELTGKQLKLRLQGETQRYVYDDDLTEPVKDAILRARTEEDRMPLIEVFQSHHTGRWTVFTHRQRHYVDRGEQEGPPPEGFQDG